MSTGNIALTAEIISAYAAHNSISSADLVALIGRVHGALDQIANPAPRAVDPYLDPAVPIKKSVFGDYIVCLEDGKKFKSLKRHLRTAFNLSPDEYRRKWNLPDDYPMVAANYTAQRSALAKSLGLGQLRRGPRGRAKAK